MARIAGVDLPREKRVEIALTYIFGIGKTTSQTLISSTGLNKDTRVRDLTEDEVSKLREAIDKTVKVEGIGPALPLYVRFFHADSETDSKDQAPVAWFEQLLQSRGLAFPLC